MFFLMFKDCRERRLGGGEHARRTLTSCGLRGIAAANVGIFVETDKQKRRFVPNLRTGGGELLSLALAWGDPAVATQRKSFQTRPPDEPTSGGEGENSQLFEVFRLSVDEFGAFRDLFPSCDNDFRDFFCFFPTLGSA